ncbi:MAG TPA: hypothetical protein VLV87_05965 [Gammaproteobacteria bacterium]|nr:hypothetical protein [Gammaproteobacteria bacterium]
MADVERLALERRRLLLISLLSYAVWCGALALQMSPWFTSGTVHWLALVQGLFMLPWTVSLFWLLHWQRRVKAQPHVSAALNDEMTVRIRWRAGLAAQAVMTVSLVVGVVLTSFVKLNAPFVLMVLIWILVISKIGCYLWFDRG